MRRPEFVPIREFVDSRGVSWRVWSTFPPAGRIHAVPLQDGWLTFESGESKRRLAPIPDGWELAPPLQLEVFCDVAEEYRPARRSIP